MVNNLKYWVHFPNSFSDLLRNDIQEITFNNPYHYWLGYLVVTRLKTLSTPEEIKYASHTIKCYKQLQWYYVNTLVWNLLIPLDNETKGSIWSHVVINGWLYTYCNNWNLNAIYGMLKYKIGNEQYALYAGLKYNVENWKIDTSKWFEPTLILSNWIVPVWLIYDSYSKIWFVWWNAGLLVADNNVLTGVSWVVWGRLLIDSLQKKLISWKENIIKWIWQNQINIWGISVYKSNVWVVKSSIWIKWIASFSDANYLNRNESKYISNQTILATNSLKGSSQKWYISKWLINVSYLLNKTRRNIANICRWRWQEISNTTLTYNSRDKLSKEQCWRLSNNAKIVINYDVSKQTYSPLLVVEWDGTTKVIIKKSMIWKNYLQLYLDKWQLLISNNINLVNIDKYGNYTSDNNKTVTSWAIIKWIYVIKWLIWWSDSSYNNKDFKHKLYVDGTLSSLNTIDVPVSWRKNYVDNVCWINDENKINLQTEFSWYCKDTGVWTDGVNCNSENDQWRKNALIFKTRPYNSLLLK